MDIAFLAQVLVVGTSILALKLVGSDDRSTRAKAGIIGMSGQPAWAFLSYQSGQLGVAFLSAVFLYYWWEVYNNNKEVVIGKASREDKM